MYIHLCLPSHFWMRYPRKTKKPTVSSFVEVSIGSTKHYCAAQSCGLSMHSAFRAYA